jgi:hypothetical protein
MIIKEFTNTVNTVEINWLRKKCLSTDENCTETKGRII